MAGGRGGWRRMASRRLRTGQQVRRGQVYGYSLCGGLAGGWFTRLQVKRVKNTFVDDNTGVQQGEAYARIRQPVLEGYSFRSGGRSGQIRSEGLRCTGRTVRGQAGGWRPGLLGGRFTRAGGRLFLEAAGVPDLRLRGGRVYALLMHVLRWSGTRSTVTGSLHRFRRGYGTPSTGQRYRLQGFRRRAGQAGERSPGYTHGHTGLQGQEEGRE